MIRLSKHTADDMAKRGMLLAYIEAVVARPEWVAADPQRGLTRSFGGCLSSGTALFVSCIGRMPTVSSSSPRAGIVEFDKEGRPMGVEITGARWISEGSKGARVEAAAHKSVAD